MAKYINTRTIAGPSIQKERIQITEHKTLAAASKQIFQWLVANGYQDNKAASATSYQAERDMAFSGYGSNWTIEKGK